MLGNWLDVVVVVVVVVWLVVFFEVGKSLLDAMVMALVVFVVNEAMSSLGFYLLCLCKCSAKGRGVIGDRDGARWLEGRRGKGGELFYIYINILFFL